MDLVVLRTLQFTEFAEILSLEVFPTCLGLHYAVVSWTKTGVNMRGTILSFCSRLQLDFVLPGVSGDFSSLDWSRWATKNEHVASLWFVLSHPQGIAPLSEELAFQFTLHSPRFFYTSVGSTFGFSVSERCAFDNWAEGSNMPKRYDSSFCGEQLTRRGELLGLLQAGSSPPNVNAPGLTRAPSGAIGIPRTPTGKPILFGHCAPNPGASAPLSPDVFRRLSSSAFAGLLRFHRSDLGDRKLIVAKSENSKIAKCGFLLPSSSAVAISGLDRLIGEGVTLCGHACFNTTCSLIVTKHHGTVKTLGSRRRPWDERAQFFYSVVISQLILHPVSV